MTENRKKSKNHQKFFKIQKKSKHPLQKTSMQNSSKSLKSQKSEKPEITENVKNVKNDKNELFEF